MPYSRSFLVLLTHASVVPYNMRCAGGTGSWAATDGAAIQISRTEVQLHAVAGGPAGEPQFVYAHAGHDVAIRPIEPAATPAATGTTSATSGSGTSCSPVDLVRLSRVHGSEGLRAVCALHTAAMPRSLAYVTPRNTLLFGGLDLAHVLRWSTALIGDTPQHVAYHGATNCFVVLTAAEDGSNCMRVVDAGASLSLFIPLF